MKEQIGLTLAVTASLFAFALPQARAGLVTWEFAGEVDVIFDSEGLVEGVVEIGSPFSASVTFDSTIPDVNPDNTTIGEYRDVIVDLTGSIAALDFFQTGTLGVIFIFNRPSSSDGFQLQSGSVIVPMLTEAANLGITLGDSTGTAFDSDSLPLTPPAPFDSGRFQLQNASESVVLRGDITAVVPEASTLVLLLIGAIPLFMSRERFCNNWEQISK